MSAVPVIAAGTFYPGSLFSASEQGVWYDPSDLTTMFEDSAGTIAVHTPGNGTADSPIGKILDKSGRGNHATQSTSTARPTLSARYNLLTYSEQFNNAIWVKDFSSVTADQVTAPDGTITADLFTENTASNRHIVYYSYTFPYTTTYKLSFCAKASTRSYFAVQLVCTGTDRFTAVFDLTSGTVTATRTTGAPANTSSSIASLGNGWYRCTITANSSSGAGYAVACLSDTGTPTTWVNDCPSYTGNGTSGLYIWGADLRINNGGVGLPAYQRIVDANTYDSAGFPYYIKTDGVDDSLATPSINWGTNRITLDVGITNLSGGADNILIELYNGTAVGAWSFQRYNVSSLWRFYSDGGTGTFTNGAVHSSFLVHTEVITATGYTAGTTNIIRENATQTGSNTATQGSGNYGNFPIYLFRRYNGTLAWVGRLYGAIARGASSTSTEISNTETWLNTKTKAY